MAVSFIYKCVHFIISRESDFCIIIAHKKYVVLFYLESIVVAINSKR